MLNVFTLSASINESINTAPKTKEPIVEEALPTYEFAGNIDEATQNLNFAIMMESLEAKQFCVGVDEIMVECAIGHSENFDTLCEAVNFSFIKKIGEGVQKAIAFLGGLLTKIGEWIQACVSKTSAYQKQIKALTAKVKDVDPASVSLNRYAYPNLNVGSNNQIIAAIDMLRDDYVGNLDKAVDDIDRSSDILHQMRASFNNADIADAEYKDKIASTLDERIEYYRDIIKDSDKMILKDLANRLKVTPEGEEKDISVKNVFSAYADFIRGEKKDVSIKDLGGVDAIIAGMAKSTAAMESFKESMTKYRSQLNEVSKQLKKIKIESTGIAGDNAAAIGAKAAEKAKADAGEDAGKIKVAAEKTKARAIVSSKCATLFNVVYARFMSIINTMNSIVNTAQGTIRAITNEKIAADMGILNAYVRAGKSGSAKKEEKPAEEKAE
jgi:hypothetical protein